MVMIMITEETSAIKRVLVITTSLWQVTWHYYTHGVNWKAWKLEHLHYLTLLYNHNMLVLTETWKRNDNTTLLYNNNNDFTMFSGHGSGQLQAYAISVMLSIVCPYFPPINHS